MLLISFHGNTLTSHLRIKDNVFDPYWSLERILSFIIDIEQWPMSITIYNLYIYFVYKGGSL